MGQEVHRSSLDSHIIEIDWDERFVLTKDGFGKGHVDVMVQRRNSPNDSWGHKDEREGIWIKRPQLAQFVKSLIELGGFPKDFGGRKDQTEARQQAVSAGIISD